MIPETRQPTRREAIDKLIALSDRLRANRHEVHGGCCDDGDEAVPCTSRICAIEYEAETALRDAADLLREEGMAQSEREHLHAIIADCNSLIDPEAHPELNARIGAVLLPCDEAGRCVGSDRLRQEGELEVGGLLDLVQMAANNGAWVCPLAGQTDKPKDHTRWCSACEVQSLLTGRRYVAPETEMLARATRQAARLLQEEGEALHTIRDQIERMQKGNIWPQDWAYLLQLIERLAASRVDPVPPPPDTPVFCAHCETALYHCPVCGKCEWRNGDPVPPPPHQDEQKG